MNAQPTVEAEKRVATGAVSAPGRQAPPQAPEGSIRTHSWEGIPATCDAREDCADAARGHQPSPSRAGARTRARSGVLG
eukprot:scaffold927_cov375-Prasinococcus_capsulatus_cf.AAC.19